MASRPVWKGQLRLSLVAIPIELHSARESGSKTSFRQIHKPSGKPVSYQKVVAGLGPIDTDEIVKGFQTAKNEYVLIEPEEIEEIRLETKKTLEMVQFVEQGEIAPLYYDAPYYVVPADELAQDAYRVVRDALRQTGRVGLGQLTMRGREYLCAIRPCGDGLLLETLRYEDEIRKADPLFSQIEDDPADKELLKVATQLIESKSAPFDASIFEDHYARALRELVARKSRSKKAPRAKPGEDKPEVETDAKGNVVDLMAALKKSLAADKASGGKKSAPRKKAS
ncbi:DNA end-binding protein Ku [Limimaricola variabilis]|jgi:DNA end-binding protein Ku|uniref:Non-homologous end joining protein Ku n=1 Tax=Limimaricola variabilis TaxID=1492771 RepID=A0ABR6HJD2_9RHOB|nr:Ku protein [Limimaricola variabilis]MBB3710659.1 DNA end-binding protein Ku [Limimaricola variabilis]